MDSKTTKTVIIVIVVIAALIAAMAVFAPKSAETQSDSDTSEIYFPEYSEGINDDGMFNLTAKDYVTLCNYTGIEVPAEEIAVTDEEVQEQITTIMSGRTHKVPVYEGIVEDGASLNIDYIGSIDGVEFEGGNTYGAGSDVTIGVTNFIPGFLEQLVGHEVGENFDINVTFPEEYGVEELNGQDAVFNITINTLYIDEDDVLTDEYVAENFSEGTGCMTIADIEEYIRNGLSTNMLGDYVYDYVMANCKVNEIPDSMVEYQKGVLYSYYESSYEYYAASSDISWEEFLASMGFDSEEAMYESYKEDMSTACNMSLIYQAIAEDAGISVSDDDLNEFAETNLYTYGLDNYVMAYGRPYVMNMALSDMVQTYLQDNAVITE